MQLQLEYYTHTLTMESTPHASMTKCNQCAARSSHFMLPPHVIAAALAVAFLPKANPQQLANKHPTSPKNTTQAPTLGN